ADRARLAGQRAARARVRVRGGGVRRVHVHDLERVRARAHPPRSGRADEADRRVAVLGVRAAVRTGFGAAARGAGRRDRAREEGRAMSLAWVLTLGAFLFSVGVYGVLAR